MTFAALAEAAPSFTQSGSGFDAGIFQDRNHADDHADENSQARRKKKYGYINANLVQARQSSRRGSNNQVQGAISEAQPDGAARASQHQTFQKKARHHIFAVRSQCRANGEFLSAALDAYQQQVGYV